MKCHDCGEVKESRLEYRRGRERECIVRERSTRGDVCDGCWGLRGELMQRFEKGEIPHDQFLSVQKQIQRKGKGKAAMEAVLR